MKAEWSNKDSLEMPTTTSGDYIKKEDVLGLIDKGYLISNSNYNKEIKLINELPTADVVKVVRCKGCKHLYKDGECPLRTWFTHDDDDYCSYGERRDNE